MKTHWMFTLLLAAALAITGCSKKEEPKPVKPAETGSQTETGVMDAVKETTAKAMEKASETISNFTADVDLEKTVDQLKAEAAKMSVADLQAVALKYKDAIAKKQVDIDAVAEKLKAIPMTEKLGTEAQQLTTELKTLGEALKPLTDRFMVYVDAIKAQGGDLSGLTIE